MFTTEIISHPQNIPAAVNTAVSFTCISSVSFNVSFSWSHNGSYIGGSSTTGDTSVLTVASVKNSDAGSYVCTVSGESVSVTSKTATLTYYGMMCVLHMYVTCVNFKGVVNHVLRITCP